MTHSVYHQLAAVFLTGRVTTSYAGSADIILIKSRKLFATMWLCRIFILLSTVGCFVSAGPLEEKTALSVDPFIILAESSETADPDGNQFKHSKETVEIVTSASLEKDAKEGSIDMLDNKNQNKEKPPKVPDTSHWIMKSSFNLSSSLGVVKYQSSLTGLTVVLARAESPIVNGYFCLATEAADNDGLPHTLEHLIFLGSEDYPYKEVLDLLANRCLADRTNAWTDTDHTCYTVYTAGPSGFLQILPVYMDHILYPTLREEDYLSEVHHVNGEGQDAGVVYSEMQVKFYLKRC